MNDEPVAQDDELCWLDATDLARHFRRRSLSPVEVTRATLARIDRLNPLDQRVLPGRPRGRAGCRARVRATLARRQAAQPPRRRPHVDQGSHPDPWLAHLARLEDDECRPGLERRRAGHGTPAGSGSRAARQDDHARVRLARQHRLAADRRHPQSMGHGAHARRLLRRRGGIGRGRHGRARGGNRRRRIDPDPGRLHRHGRDQAAVRSGARLARIADGHGRPPRAACAQRGRRRRHAGRAGPARPARRLVARAFRPRTCARRVRRGGPWVGRGWGGGDHENDRRPPPPDLRGLRIAYSPTLGYVDCLDPEIERALDEAAATLASLGAVVERKDPGFADCHHPFLVHWMASARHLLMKLPPAQRALLDPALQEAIDYAGASRWPISSTRSSSGWRSRWRCGDSRSPTTCC